MELGLSSMDVMEVVTASSLELGVKVPRAQLAKAQNVDALIDTLLTALSSVR